MKKQPLIGPSQFWVLSQVLQSPPKVYTCGKAKYSKSRGARGNVGGVSQWGLDHGGFGAPPTFHLAPLSFEYSARQKCILSFAGDCMCILLFSEGCWRPKYNRIALEECLSAQLANCLMICGIILAFPPYQHISRLTNNARFWLRHNVVYTLRKMDAKAVLFSQVIGPIMWHQSISEAL